MRAIEYLIQLFPEKTGAELLAIQEQDKLDDQKEYERYNAKKLAIVKDINENGGYFCGRFGCDQRYFYKFSNLRMEHGEIYMDVDSLVFFYNDPTENHRPNSSVKRDGEFNFEFRTRQFEEYDKFGIELTERVTVKEWDEVINYVKAMTKFWKQIKPF